MEDSNLAYYKKVVCAYEKSSRNEVIFSVLNGSKYPLEIIFAIVLFLNITLAFLVPVLMVNLGRSVISDGAGVVLILFWTAMFVVLWNIYKRSDKAVKIGSKYDGLLTDRYYQYSRYCNFKDKLKNEEINAEIIHEIVVLISTKNSLMNSLNSALWKIGGLVTTVAVTAIYGVLSAKFNNDPQVYYFLTFIIFYFIILIALLLSGGFFKKSKILELILFLQILKNDMKSGIIKEGFEKVG